MHSCIVLIAPFPSAMENSSINTYLVACGASWFKLFRVMPLAEKRVVVHAISEIDQELFTIRASEARRMKEQAHFAG